MADAQLPAISGPRDAPSFNIRSLTGLFLGLVVFAILNVALTLFVLDRNNLLHPPEIVSVDAATMVMAFVASQDSDISESELQSKIVALNSNLDAAMARYAQSRGVVVVNSAAVLGGTRDVTQDVLADLGALQ